MSKKEEALRRSVLSRESAARRVAPVLVIASMLGAVPFRQQRINHDAERGRFGNGDFHPDKCSCKMCSDWRRAERFR